MRGISLIEKKKIIDAITSNTEDDFKWDDSDDEEGQDLNNEKIQGVEVKSESPLAETNNDSDDKGAKEEGVIAPSQKETPPKPSQTLSTEPPRTSPQKNQASKDSATGTEEKEEPPVTEKTETLDTFDVVSKESLDGSDLPPSVVQEDKGSKGDSGDWESWE